MKIRLIAFLAAFGLTIVLSIIGNILEVKGFLVREDMSPGAIKAVIGVGFGCFCLLAVTATSLALHGFILGQIRIGNGDHFAIRFLQTHEKEVYFGILGVFVLALLINAILYVIAPEIYTS